MGGGGGGKEQSLNSRKRSDVRGELPKNRCGRGTRAQHPLYSQLGYEKRMVFFLREAAMPAERRDN